MKSNIRVKHMLHQSEQVFLRRKRDLDFTVVEKELSPTTEDVTLYSWLFEIVSELSCAI